MQNISQSEFSRLIDGASVLEADSRGPRIYLTADNKVVKLFPRKGFFSSNTLSPYAARFRRNAQRLKSEGVNSVTVERIGKCSPLKLHFVVYPFLAGSTLRELATQPAELRRALTKLSRYLCDLHRQGIFFKAFHLGNIIQQSNGRLALIDIQSMHFYTQAVPLKDRLKNFSNCLRYKQDYQLLHQFGFESFFSQYLRCSDLKPVQQSDLLAKLRASFSQPDLDQALRQLQARHPAPQ